MKVDVLVILDILMFFLLECNIYNDEHSDDKISSQRRTARFNI